MVPTATLALVLTAFLAATAEDVPEGPKVQTTKGWIQGGFTKTRGGRTISEFLGIKYAKEPSGNLRFKDPKPVDPWEGTIPATQQCSSCMQSMVLVEALRNTVSGVEDCLCINVFTPQISSKKLPVIFWIHGGAYTGFSSDKANYGPELLLDHDVILVTMNYRVGVLGFLSTEDSVIPGNWAMKDLVLALHWVRDNIERFGGDPDSVTLMGESSGAACVHLLMLSPVAQGLFHRAIAHSGSALTPWGVAPPGVIKERAKQLAGYVGCPTTNSSAMLSCLQDLPAKDIVDKTKRYLVWDVDPVVIWSPTVEQHDVNGAFLVQRPQTLTSTVPFLTGFNYAEGGTKTFPLTMGDVTGKFQQWNSEFQKLTALSLFVKPDLVDKIRDFYFGSAKEITPQMTTQITEMYGDFWFSNGVLDAVEHHKGAKFLYFFNYNNTNQFSLFGSLFNNPLYLGTSHFDELPYVFPMDGTYKKVDEALSAKVIEMWINFVKTSSPGNSVANWAPVASPALEYLDISNTYLGMRSCPLKKRRDFYKSLNPYNNF